MAIRQIDATILNTIKKERKDCVPTLLANKPCNELRGMSTSETSLQAAANAGKELAQLFS